MSVHVDLEWFRSVLSDLCLVLTLIYLFRELRKSPSKDS